MKKISTFYFSFVLIVIAAITITGNSGCANIIPPTGGPRDSLPPVLIASNPKDSALRFTGNTINLTFDEFVEVGSTYENVLFSPTPNTVPIINSHLRNVTIKIKDTLEPNTTYSINFGNAIKDVNEGNVYKNFTYVFSTGDQLDQNTLSGRVILAETGTVDSTLIAVLHRNLDDSAVVKEKPRYIARLDGKGNFEFRNLAAGTFALYAIPNEFSRRYDDTTKPFAFASQPVNTTRDSTVTLLAYSLPKRDTTTNKVAATTKPRKAEKEDKQLRVTSSIEGGRQDLLEKLALSVSKPIRVYDSTKIILTNKSFAPVTGYNIALDTTKTNFTISYNWPANTEYNLIIDKSAFADSAGLTLAKNDTLNFTTKNNEDYGSVRARFKNLDFSKNPVLQIVQNDQVLESIGLTQPEWTRKLFAPGDYELRILFDQNKNGVWDPGKFFSSRIQPESVITLKSKLNVRANWDNEPEFSL